MIIDGLTNTTLVDIEKLNHSKTLRIITNRSHIDLIIPEEKQLDIELSGSWEKGDLIKLATLQHNNEFIYKLWLSDGLLKIRFVNRKGYGRPVNTRLTRTPELSRRIKLDQIMS